MFEFILEFLRLSFTTYPGVLLVSTGPLVIIVGALTIVWFVFMSIYVAFLAIRQWARGEPVGWSRPMTENEKILVAGSKDVWYPGWMTDYMKEAR